MIHLTPDALVSFMRKNSYQSDIQEDTKQVYTILKINHNEYPLFLRIFGDGHLLQVLVFLPSHLEPNPSNSPPIKQDVIGDVARLLHLFNKELDVPGFGMDETAGVVFYRIMLPVQKKKIDEELLLAYIKTTEHVCKMFSNSIEAISSGQMTLNEVLAKAKEEK